MAEAALFSLASKLLITIASPAFQKAYERARSIHKAKKELKKLKKTIQTIQAMLLDAEKRQEDGSAAVKDLMKRIRDVLYEADDLFDEVVTTDLLKQRMDGNKVVKEVRIAFSRFNPFISNDAIAKKIKEIRESLHQVSDDMTLFNFVKHDDEKPASGMRRGVETGAFVNPDEVVGRDDEKKAILDFLQDTSYAEQNISVFAIVGIGGMGKSTLAQLVYNDENIQKCFQKRWWACISDIFDEKEVTGKIFQSITGEPYHDLDLNHMQSKIRESICKNKTFLLVLDDLWDEDHAMGKKLRSLLSSNDAKGSKIILTTRSSSAAKAMDAENTQVLDGLSGDASWELFKSLAFTRQQENDPNWIDLGEKIVKKCANVPLAIKSIASLLYTKATIQEWKSFEDGELSEIDLSHGSIISTLKLSYNHLSSNLKHCFACCSLFPKDYEIEKNKLIYLWIAQGYVKPINEKQTVEEAGHAYFMELVRRSFFQKAGEDRDGEICTCKMHDLIHDLAQNVAGEEGIIMKEGLNHIQKKIRHLSVVCQTDSSWNLPPSLLSSDRLRSFLFLSVSSASPFVLDQMVTKFKFLRALDLRSQNITNVACSIGDLKHLRYLNLSGNHFKHLPDSITELVNLLTLSVCSCRKLETLPNNFRKLVNLRQLDTKGCRGLMYMPPGFEELTCLQNLSYFKMGNAVGASKISRVDALVGLNLKGLLEVKFDGDIDERWQLPTTISVLEISNYPWFRIPHWWRRADAPSLMPNLVELYVYSSSTLKHLPPLKRLPCLKTLQLSGLTQLEYIEEDDENESGQSSRPKSVAVSTTLFFPSLKSLKLRVMPKLKAWSRQVEEIATSKGKTVEDENNSITYCPDHLHQMPLFPVLSLLEIYDCGAHRIMPLFPSLVTLKLGQISNELVLNLLSPYSHSFSSTTPLYLEHLETISIDRCSLKNFPGKSLTSLRVLQLECCGELKNLYLAPSQCNVLEELRIQLCPKLELWKKWSEDGLDWDSFPNLRILALKGVPGPITLPDCLQRLLDLGLLQIFIEKRYEDKNRGRRMRQVRRARECICNLGMEKE